MPVEPPPPYEVHGVTVPGRTWSQTNTASVVISFHPDDADDAERLVSLVRAAAIGRTVTYEIR